MKYFVVTSTIKDGEYEYLQQSPVSAKTEAEAIKRVENENQEWTQDDYREYEIDGTKECTKEEYYIIKKYIY